MARFHCAALLILGLVLPAGAAAEERQLALLVYQSPDDIECPDALFIRNAVNERLGYEAFTHEQGASRRVEAVIEMSGDGLVGVISLFDAQGELVGRRTLESPGNSCEDFAEALTLGLALALDPLGGQSGSSAPPDSEDEPDVSAQSEDEPDVSVQSEEEEVEETSERGGAAAWGPPPPTAVQAAEPTQPDAPTDDARPIEFRLKLGAHGDLGAAPHLAFGINLHVGFRWRAFSLDLEGRFDVPAKGDSLGGEVKTTLLALSLVPCLHWRIISGCVVVLGGVVRGEGIGYVDTATVALPYVAVGGRFGLEVPLWRWFGFHAHLELLGALTRLTFEVGDQSAWSSWPVVVGFGCGFSVSF